MAKTYVASEPLFRGRARAANPGDLIAESTLKNNPHWRDKVALRGSPAAGEIAGQYDPAAHDVDDVLDHLAASDEDEVARVLAAEESGKARKTILGGA